MSLTHRSLLTRYGAALLSGAAALAARMLLDPVFGNHHPFTTFYIAVAAVAWYGGLGPSLLTIVCSCVAADYFFIPPRGSLGIALTIHWFDLACFVFVSSTISIFSYATRGAQRQAEAKALEALQKRKELELEIMERLRLESELELHADELAEANRRKNEFLAILGHELRNPLAPIRSAVQFLRLDSASEPDRRWARDVIDRQTEQMTRLVDDLLEISRVSRGKIKLIKTAIELAEVIERAVENSHPLIGARKHELIESLPAEPVWLEADPVRLAQVVANLLNNAAKYTPDRGHIWLSAEKQGAEAVIRVRDDGLGIAPDMLPRVFDLFAQADRTLEESRGGLGIGLTLVKCLLEMHGGTVKVLSDGPGKGSEFVVRLPALERKPTPGTNDGENVKNRPPSSARRILIVDDNGDAAKSLALLLEVHGHDVRTAPDGPAALKEAEAFQPEIVFLDIGLPGMDGYEAARRLREMPGLEDASLFALTGYGQDDDRRRSQEAGCDGHLVKPVGLDLLLPLIARSKVRARIGNS